MRVLVCGGRDFNDKNLLVRVLDSFYNEGKFTHGIFGRARGADTLAELWAMSKDIPCQLFPAEWEKYGKSAGFRRNTQMLVEGKPDLVIAFPGGAGTRMMIDIATKAGVPVVEIDPNAYN